MSTNQIGALTTLILVGVVYIGTPLWAERRGRNWKIWLFLAFLFPGISLVALFLLPNKKGKPSVTDPLNWGTGTPAQSKANQSVITYDKEQQRPPELSTSKIEGKDKLATGPTTKKSYTEEFKKEVVHTALTAGTSLSEIARMYEINLTLVRNWKAKYEAEILQQINGTEGNEELGGGGSPATDSSIGGVAGEAQDIGGISSDPSVATESPVDEGSTEGLGTGLSSL